MSARSNSSVSATHEQIINRWCFDFYVFEAFSAFRNGDFCAFADFINIIESLVVRPMNGHSDIIVKLRFMQFLSRINNGDRFDMTFEDPLSPLESALMVLKSICTDMNVPHADHQRIHNSIKDTLIMVCIRAGEFDRAEQMLHKHFPKGTMDSAGKKKLFMNLIRNRRRSHTLLQTNSYSDFKQDMLDFIERLYTVPQPFLIKMLRSPDRRTASGGESQISSSVQKRSTADYTCVRSSADGSASPPATPTQVSLQNLRLVYSKLSEVYGVRTPFSQLQRDVQNEALMENRTQSDAELHLALSETPHEKIDTQQDSEDADVHPELQQSEGMNDITRDQSRAACSRYAGMTVSRLVLEDDSQASEDECQDDVIAHDEESTQIDIVSPDRPSPQTPSDRHIIVNSQESDPGTPAPASVNQTHVEKHKESCAGHTHYGSPQSINHKHRENQHNKSGPESDPDHQLIRSPAHHTPDKQQHNRNRMTRDSESNPERQSETRHISPLSDRHTHEENHSSSRKKHHKRQRIASDSESEQQIKTPARQTRYSSSRSPSVSETHTEKQSDKRVRRWLDVTGTHEDWSDEESLFSVSAGLSRKEKQSRKKWTVEESNWLKEGVRRFGEGRWGKIHSAFPFKERTPVNLKDRWRTMKKLKLV